jgi:hypothetical protein
MSAFILGLLSLPFSSLGSWPQPDIGKRAETPCGFSASL